MDKSTKFLTKKVVILFTIIAIAALAIMFLFASNMADSAQDKIYLKTKERLTQKLEHYIDEKYKIGLIASIALASNHEIQRALIENNRTFAMQALGDVASLYSNNTDLKDIKIHIHTKDVTSFLRSWNKEKYGDKLDTFRYSINVAKNSKKALMVAEIGELGLNIRGVSPIIKDSNYIGSIEFIQGIDSMVESFKDKDISLIAISKDTHLYKTYKKNTKLGSFRIFQKNHDENFKKAIENIDFNKLQDSQYITHKGYFITSLPILDLDKNQIGMYITGEKLDKIHVEVREAKSLIDTGIILLISAFLTFMIVFYISRKSCDFFVK